MNIQSVTFRWSCCISQAGTWFTELIIMFCVSLCGGGGKKTCDMQVIATSFISCSLVLLAALETTILSVHWAGKLDFFFYRKIKQTVLLQSSSVADGWILETIMNCVGRLYLCYV